MQQGSSLAFERWQPVPSFDPPPQGSNRRRRELADRAQWPLLGTCLPIANLRRFANKLLGGEVESDSYDLHPQLTTAPVE